MRHCDDAADDPKTPDCVRDFINHVRSPAHGAFLESPCPTLFAKHGGVVVQVVFASRMGDLAITPDLKPGARYRRRVAIDELNDFSSALPTPANGGSE